MPRLDMPEVLIITTIACLMIGGLLVFAILPFWMIFSKAGFSPWLSLTQIIPLVNIVALFYLAFAEWPVRREAQLLREQRT